MHDSVIDESSIVKQARGIPRIRMPSLNNRLHFLFAVLLTYAPAMSHGETTRPADTCTLFMAPSTIPNAGIGVFTAVDVKEGENVGYPDLAIPVTDVDWHNGGDRQVCSSDNNAFMKMMSLNYRRLPKHKYLFFMIGG